jgi:cysteinyl-tRNA synthetase
MDNDFNTAGAMGILQEYTRRVNSLLNGDTPLSKASLTALDTVYRELGGTILGIIPDEVESSGSDAKREAGLIELLLTLRQQARANKDWATSDKVRDELKALGVSVEDRADGSIWKIVD